MTDHQYILCIETATPVCSVALVNHGTLVARREANEPNIHASSLTLFIEEVVRTAGITLGELSAVAVSKGPGSYTGLRIGVSVAKGICYALDLPLIAVNTLEAMAFGFVQHELKIWSEDILLCPMIDARRMEVYTAIYGESFSTLKNVHALIVDEHTFDAQVEKEKTMLLFGSGADKFKDLFAAHDKIRVVEGFQNSASFMINIATDRYSQAVFEDMAYFEPFYLKDFVATTPKKLV